MGSCFSTKKITGSNSNTTTTTVNLHNHHQGVTKPAPSTTSTSNNPTKLTYKNNSNNKNQVLIRHKDKASSRRQNGVIPCGKRTDFGYDKDFDLRYTIGKLLGHGQFGYTYVAVDRSNGDRVAVKKIDKNKVPFFFFCLFLILNLVMYL